MQDKIIVLVIYGLVGLLLAIFPLFVRRLSRASAGLVDPGRYGMWGALLSLAATIGLLVYFKSFTFDSLLLIVVSGVAAVAAIRRASLDYSLHACAATFLACVVSTTLPWWRWQPGNLVLSGNELICFGLLLGGGVAVILSCWRDKGDGLRTKLPLLSIYALVSAYFCFTFASIVNTGSLVALWHHWGAYIGPSELLLAGARLFYDIPAQYGAGPTVTLALLCGNDCWSAAHWFFGLITFAYFMLIGVIALCIQPGNRYRDAWVLLTCLIACAFWTAFPPFVTSMLATPSVAGARFLPALMLVVWVFISVNQRPKVRTLGGFALWSLGAFWSPESAFYVTAIWWPLYLFDAQDNAPQGERIKAMAVALMRLLVFAFVLLFVLVMLYRMAYGVFPQLTYFLTYALNPPGPLPIDPQGAVWFFVLVMGLSLCEAWSHWLESADSARFRRSFVLQLLAFSTFSYFLGRSHDNNILNLMPFLMLLLFDTFDLANRRGRTFARYAAAFSLASVVAWSAIFGWGGWLNSYQTKSLFDFDFNKVKSQLNYQDPASLKKLAARLGYSSSRSFTQAKLLMDSIQQRGEPFIVLDGVYNLQPLYPANAWSAIYSTANFTYVPSALRQAFLRNTADRLGLGGWLIVERHFDSAAWLADYDAVYQRAERIDLEDYYAIKYVIAPNGGGSQ